MNKKVEKMNGFEAWFWFYFQLAQVAEVCQESAWWKFVLYCSPLTQVTGHKNLKMGRFVANLGAKECGRGSVEDWLQGWNLGSSGTMQELPLTSAKPLEFVRTGHKRQQFEKLKLQIVDQGSRGFLQGGYLHNGHESTHQPWQEKCWSFRSCLQICTAIWSLGD